MLIFSNAFTVSNSNDYRPFTATKNLHKLNIYSVDFKIQKTERHNSNKKKINLYTKYNSLNTKSFCFVYLDGGFGFFSWGGWGFFLGFLDSFHIFVILIVPTEMYSALFLLFK